MKICKKVFSIILSLTLALSAAGILPVGYADSGYSSSEKLQRAEGWCEELSGLFAQLAALNIESVYDSADYEIVKKFTEKMNTETDDTKLDYYFEALAEIYGRVRENLKSYINGSSLPIQAADRCYRNIKLENGHFYSVEAENEAEKKMPVVAGGYSAWQSADDDMRLSAAVGSTSTEGPTYEQRKLVTFANGELMRSTSADAELERIKDFLDMCEKLNLCVSFGIDTIHMPDGYIGYYKSNGIRDDGGEYSQYLNYNPTHPAIEALHKKQAEILLPELEDYSCITSIYFVNEPQFEAYDKAYYGSEWEAHLKSEYSNDISKLNEAYGSTYTEFSEVKMPPVPEQTALYYDYREFTTDILKEYFTTWEDIIHKYLPDMPIGVKLMEYTRAGNRKNNDWNIKYEKYKDILSINYNDAFSFVGDTTLNIQGKMLWYDYLGSIIDAPVVNGENHVIKDMIGTDPEAFDYSEKIPSHVAADMWQGAIHGADQTSDWLLSDNDYTNARYKNSSALYRPDLMSAVSKTTLDMERLAEQITALQDEEADTAILYSDASWTYDNTFTENNYKAYLSAIYNGHKACFITESTLDRLDGQKILIVASAKQTSADTVRKIKQFAENGGKVVFAGEDMLSRDKHNLALPEDVSAITAELYSSQTVADSADALEKKMAELYAEMSLNTVTLIDEATGRKPASTEWTVGKSNGKYIVNIISYDWETAPTVGVYLDGVKQTELKELRSDKAAGSAVTLSACEPVMIEIQESEKTASYEPKNVMAIQASNTTAGVTMSWINPTAETLSKVSVYDYSEDGNDTLLSDALSTAAGAVVQYRHTGLTNGSWKMYRIHFDFSDGEETDVFTSAHAKKSEYQAFIDNTNNKRFGINYSEVPNIPASINKIRTEGTNHYLDFRTNIAEGSGEQAVMVFTLDDKMTANERHKLTFKSKSETEFKCDLYIGTTEIGNKKYRMTVPRSDEWAVQTVEFDVNWAAERLFLIFPETVEGWSVDDLKFEVSETGEVLGSKDFEYYTAKYPAPLDYPKAIRRANATPYTNSAVIEVDDPSPTWWDSAADAPGGIARVINFYNVYEVSGSERIFRARIPKATLENPLPKLRLTGLTEGKCYTYELTCEDFGGIFESAPVEVSVVPAESYTTSSYSFTSGGETGGGVLYGRNYTAGVTLSAKSEAMTAQLAVGIYDGGVLQRLLVSDKISVEKGETGTAAVNGVDLSAYTGDDLFVKCFLFEDIEGLKPLKEMKKFPVY